MSTKKTHPNALGSVNAKWPLSRHFLGEVVRWIRSMGKKAKQTSMGFSWELRSHVAENPTEIEREHVVIYEGQA